jgi:hypothetical protein
LADTYLPLLVETGLTSLSSKGLRVRARDADLNRCNIHCVPIEWTEPPCFGDEGVYLRQLCDHLALRRSGGDRLETTGVLTHHLVQDDASWRFMARLREMIVDHPAARWADPAILFGLQAGLSSDVNWRTASAPSVPSIIQ